MVIRETRRGAEKDLKNVKWSDFWLFFFWKAVKSGQVVLFCFLVSVEPSGVQCGCRDDWEWW